MRKEEGSGCEVERNSTLEYKKDACIQKGWKSAYSRTRTQAQAHTHGVKHSQNEHTSAHFEFSFRVRLTLQLCAINIHEDEPVP